MESLTNNFQKEVALQIFPGNAPPEIQYWTFMYRFDRENYKLRHTEIAEKLNDTLGGEYESGINQFIKEVIKKLYRTYGAEMTQDGISQKMLGLGKGVPGKKSSETRSPWQVAYKWLWAKKYSRWQEDYFWSSWQKQAQLNSQWLKFSHTNGYASRAMVMPTPKPKDTLPVNTPLNLEINLGCSPDSYVLLFNRGQDVEGNTTRYLISPSYAFAPNNRLTEKSIRMPQKNAMCENISFDAEGKEEYIAIVTDELCDGLPWLNTDEKNPCLEWHSEHLRELWDKLQTLQNESWYIFYCNFDVVAA